MMVSDHRPQSALHRREMPADDPIDATVHLPITVTGRQKCVEATEDVPKSSGVKRNPIARPRECGAPRYSQALIWIDKQQPHRRVRHPEVLRVAVAQAQG